MVYISVIRAHALVHRGRRLRLGYQVKSIGWDEQLLGSQPNAGYFPVGNHLINQVPVYFAFVGFQELRDGNPLLYFQRHHRVLLTDIC